MKIVTLASVRGSPGVTTTSLLLASTFESALIVEADFDGGVLAVRYGLGREPGLTTFAASNSADPWQAHAQDAGGVPVLVGPDSPGTAASLWHTAGERIAHQLIAAEGTAVVDAGRLRSPVPIVSASDVLLLLVAPVAEQLVGLGHLLPMIRRDVHGYVAAVLVGDGPYRAQDVESTFDVPVLGVIPDDRGTAEALRSGTGPRTRLSRSRLARATTELSAEVKATLDSSLEGVTS